MASFQAPPVGWPGPQGITTTPLVKKVIRLDVPVDKYPNVIKSYCSYTAVYISFLFQCNVILTQSLAV